MPTTPTQYSDINQLLARLLTQIQSVLGKNLVGLYLYGSLAAGDFEYESSDIDVVAATTARLDAQELQQVKTLHEDIAAHCGRWGKQLEVAYLPLIALRRDDPSDCQHPSVSSTTPFGIHILGWDWVINRYVLREKGLTLYGPSPATLIDPIPPEQLTEAIRQDLCKGWREYLAGPDVMHSRRYQAFMIATLCRALYTLDCGDFTSKPQAVAWAEQHLPSEWTPLIQRALAWRNDDMVDIAALPETLRFLHFALNRCEDN